MPKYNVNNICNGFKVHIKIRFVLLNLINQELEELWIKLDILLGKNEEGQCQSKKERKIEMDIIKKNTENY